MGISCTCVGNLGKDVEINYAQSGFAFGKTSIACRIPAKDKETGQIGTTEWMNLTFLGKAAENAAQVLYKGCKCMVTGYIQTEEYQDQQGQTIRTHKLMVRDWEPLSPKAENPNQQGGGQPQGQQGGFGGQPQGQGQQGQQGPQGAPQQNFSGQGANGPAAFNPGQQQQTPQGAPQQTPPFNPNQPGQQAQPQPQAQNPAPQNNQGAGQGFGQAGGQGTGTDVPF